MIPFAGGELEARRWRAFENLMFLEETQSSNDLAVELIDMYFEEDEHFPTTVLVAESEPGAHGRRGKWIAPPGRGLYFTFVRQARPGEPISLMPIAVARWLRDALREATGARITLKWPNDLYVGRRKVGGILAEARTQGDDTYVAVGVGLNVLGSAGSLEVEGATTLEEETGRAFALAPLLQSVLDSLDAELASPRWAEEVHAWERASVHRPGDRLTVRKDDRDITGRYVGLSPEGFLRLQTSAGETIVSTGMLAKW
ncbi:MAG TPA: biotin--[acetyl-CoA-carboxylase] ligase [Thermoanaerobaculia bacterium]|nr:biotin--[acetyl-CoA-carboxylase] ligase [Thermoanaerobaculia bacterium]